MRERPPQGPAPKPFHLAETTDFTLPNGMRVTMAPYGAVPKVAVRAFVSAGAVNESAGQVWLSKLTALMMREGTATRTAEQVAREAAEMGGQLEIASGADFTSAGGVVLSDYGTQFVALLAEVLAAPALPESETARLQGDLQRELAIAKTEPASIAMERFRKTLFPDHPYGRTFPGEAQLQGYTTAEVRAFHAKYFSAARTHLYVAGKLEGDLRGTIEQTFGGWKRGEVEEEAPVHPATSRSIQVVDRPGAAQTNLLVGLPVADPQSPDFIKLEVMDTLLGGSFASRITTNIREGKGYTYSPHSQIATRRRLGFWVQSADVNTTVTGPALREIFYEIDRLRREPPSAAELAGIQSYMAGIFVLRNTISPDAIIGQLHFVDAQGLERAYLARYVERVMEVTPDDVQKVAATYLDPGKMTIVAAGDRARVEESVEKQEDAP